MNGTTLSSDNPLRFRKSLLWKWALLRKSKLPITKLSKIKAQYDLDRQTAKRFVLSSRNVSKYKIFTCKDVLPEKDSLEKTATMKRFEFSLLGKRLKSTDWHCKETVLRIRPSLFSNKDNKSVNESLIKK